MYMRQNCKECPWVNKNENNLKFIGHAKRHNKTHNCHMISPNKRGMVWDTKEDCICVGSKNWPLNQNKKDEYESKALYKRYITYRR